MDYAALIAPLINSIKEQSKVIELQKNKISSLEKRLNHLEALITNIESKKY